MAAVEERADAGLVPGESLERTLIRHFPNGIVILVDHDLRWVVVDGQELARTGRVAADLEGRTIWENYPPDVCAEIEPHLRRVLAGESVTYEVDYNGRRSFVQGEPILVDGRVVGAAVSTQEASELRTKLGEAEVQQRTLLEHLPRAAVVVVDRELRVVQVSRSIESFGWNREDVLGRTLAEWMPGREDVVALYEAALAGTPCSVDHRSVRGGRTIWLQVVPLRDGDRVFGAMSIAQDVTDRSRDEDERRSEALGVLAAGVAHDFNNLLQGVLGHAALALAELPPHAPARRRVEQIADAAGAAAALADKMLAYSGVRGLELEDVNLSALAVEAYGRVAPALRAAATVRWQLGDAVPPVRGDARRLAQIPLALIENALEAKGNLTISTYADGAAAVLEVSDDGDGMDAATRERMFEPFFSTRFAGRGLGLAAVDGIAAPTALRSTSSPSPAAARPSACASPLRSMRLRCRRRSSNCSRSSPRFRARRARSERSPTSSRATCATAA
ncbi:MAG TPA: PAS domain-containing protein [Gaiellaceae bacterium]|nr:PAS domain-containing protein [Gaiellaceae bacterium]